MSTDDLYAAPNSQVADEPVLKPSLLVRIMAVLLTVLTAAILAPRYLAQGGVSFMVGGMLGVVLFAMLFVGIFQLGRRFRNPRSRWRIYAWSQLLGLLGQLSILAQSVTPP